MQPRKSIGHVAIAAEVQEDSQTQCHYEKPASQEVQFVKARAMSLTLNLPKRLQWVLRVL